MLEWHSFTRSDQKDPQMKIVVPFDGSPPSHRAVDYALRIAASVGKESVTVPLLNVQEADPQVLDFFARDAAELAARLTKQRRESGVKLLEAPVAKIQEAGVTAEPVVLLGEPAEVIASFVDRQRCDMVVMGTRGLGRVGGLLLGSVASKVIHLVKVPVTLVK
jgi:nucleotide-binding universal stress UspA family protein